MKFLENILAELKRAGIVASRRGAEGGYWLARPPSQVSVADIIRAVEGPLADVRGVRPESARLTVPISAPSNACGSRCGPTSGPCSNR